MTRSARRAVAVILLTFSTAPGWSQTIIGQTDWAKSSFDTNITAWGSGTYYNGSGEREEIGISGTLSLYSAPETLESLNWGVEHDGDLSIDLSHMGNYNTCYGSSVAFDTRTKYAEFYSEWKCIPPPPAAPPPETQLADGSDEQSSGSDCETKLSGDGSTMCESTPIIIDLGTDGFHLTSVADGVNFDLRADGIPRRVAWTARDAENAFLARDNNGNGRIDDGSELFGNGTRLSSGDHAEHGFAALAEFDVNRDGVIDERDPVWSSLLVWIDRNHDGTSDSDELQPLASTSVVALETTPVIIGRRDRWGNVFRYAATLYLAQDTRVTPRQFYDIILQTSK